MGALRKIKRFISRQIYNIQLMLIEDEIKELKSFISCEEAKVDCVASARNELAQLREKKYKLIIEMSTCL